MGTIATDDQISRHRRSVAQCCLDTVVVLAEILDAGVEAIVGLVVGRLIEHIDQITAQDLQLGDQPVAVERRHRHLRSAAPIGFDPGHATLIERTLAHLLDQAHVLDHVAAGASQVDGLSAGPNPISELNDSYAISALVEPEGKCRPCDSCSADQDGRRCHERKGSR
jgi:hypothetical protein